MRPELKDFVKVCVDNLVLSEPIHEFGAAELEGQASFDIKELFPDKVYIGSDIIPGKGVDVILDLHKLDLPNASVSTAICLDVYEQVEYPLVATKEVYRVLKENGVFILGTVLNWPIHEYPHDYWRFTEKGLRILMQDFAEVITRAGGGGRPGFPTTTAAIGFKTKLDDDTRFKLNAALDKWVTTLTE